MTKTQLGWVQIFQTGAVIDLDIGRWSARAAMKAKDVGIPDSDAVHRVLSLGCLRLVPKKAFEAIDEIAAEAKRLVENNSLIFNFVKGARYTPDAKLPGLLSGLREIATRHSAAADIFTEEIGKVREEYLPVVKKALFDAAQDEEIAQAAYERFLSEYPPPDEIRRRFYLRWNVYSIAGAKNAAGAEAAEAEAESVKSIVRSMIEQLRDELKEKVGSVMVAVAKGGKLPAPTVDSAKEVIARVRSMNVFGDRVLEEQTSALLRIIEEAQKGKIFQKPGSKILSDIVEIQRTLESSVEQAVKDAEETLTGVGKRKIITAKKEVA